MDNPHRPATGSRPEAGDRAPDFFLPDQRDIIISLYDKVRGRPIAVMFYPDSGDVIARRELMALGACMPALRAGGPHIFTVGGETVQAVGAMRARHKLDEPVLCMADPGRLLLKKYGLAADETVMFLLDPNQRVLAERAGGDGESLADQALALLDAAPPPPRRVAGPHPPVLLIPRVLDPPTCRWLIDQFGERGHQESGTFRMVDGKMVHSLNHAVKRRRDHHVMDADLTGLLGRIMQRRVLPEIRRAFQCRITRVEEFKLVCYDSEPAGYFHVHRDNTTPQTMHRRFAMTLNLNTGEYEGGVLQFPEYGYAGYRPDTGEAAIFSCDLLHEATPVTRGRRHVLLSFLYDEAGERQRATLARALRAGKSPVRLG